MFLFLIDINNALHRASFKTEAKGNSQMSAGYGVITTKGFGTSNPIKLSPINVLRAVFLRMETVQ